MQPATREEEIRGNIEALYTDTPKILERYRRRCENTLIATSIASLFFTLAFMFDARPWITSLLAFSVGFVIAISVWAKKAMDTLPHLVRYTSLREDVVKTEPNQAPEPTPTAVTPPAGQEARQP